ncbi:sensor histidine kinase [Undibacterium sp. SXout7W]|uniref:sensor histidine kinase n=1 Tax=Undibacterium sp. SXout7W TaxID=3413049 RepID=UPI003BF35D4B
MADNQDHSSEWNLSDDYWFRLLVDSIDEYAVYMLDEEGYVRSWNLGAEHLKGYSKDEILGQHFSVLYTPDAIAADLPHNELNHAAQSGRYQQQGWRQRKDGSRFWGNVTITALRDTNGVVRGYAKVTKDMTGHQQLEERFRRVVESAPNAMVMINAGGRIEMVNAQAEQVFEYARAEMLGQPMEMLVPERFRHAHPEKRAMFFEHPQSRPMGAGRELFGRRKDGTEFPIEIGLNPIDTEDGLMVLSSIVDISDRKQKEEKIQSALKEKDLLLGEIHHRVKNNLQIVQSLLNLQAGQMNDEAVRGMLMDSQNRIQSMALIHQTLYQSNDFASVNFSSFLEALVPTIVTSFGIDTGNLQLHLDASDVHLPINSAIPCGLLINELITNSLKHAFPARQTGDISVTLSYAENDRVQLIVSDTGVGIPDTLDFDQIDTLGLRLVHLLSQQMNGSLQIQRRHPTQFLVDFPISDH